MAMTTQAQNYTTNLIGFAEQMIALKATLDDLQKRFQLNSLSGQLTTGNLGEIEGFKHLSSGEIDLIQAAIADLKTLFEASGSAHLNTMYLFKP